MYKKQIRFQKIACVLAILTAAITFIYALGIITDIYDSLYATMMNPKDLTQTYVPGSIIYYDMQQFNQQYLYCGIGLILLGAFLFVTNTHTRRKYYIGNYVAIGAYCVATAAVGIWSHLQISAFKVQYLTTVDFGALKAFAELWGYTYIESTFLLDLHYGVAALSVAAMAALLVSMVWKNRMMRQERALIEKGKEALV